MHWRIAVRTMISRFLSIVLLLALVAVHGAAQAPASYEDVLLIINENDSNSVAIGGYFAARRAIPAVNVLRVRCSSSEVVDFAEFTVLREQIERHLIASGRKDSINYIVTTKGVPLSIMHGGVDDQRNASVDAELMLLLGAHAAHIGENTLFPPGGSVTTHPYFNRDTSYRRCDTIPNSVPRASYDLYLTTRLTGLTREDVFRLIDRSGPYTLVNKDSARFVFDRDPNPIQLYPLDMNLDDAGTRMRERGWNALVNSDSVYVTGERNVIGYGSWGSNDHYDHLFTDFARPHFHWLPGSLAETYVSTSARNFTPGQTEGQSRIADLITEGCTGASGYVFEPFSVAITWVNTLFDRYTRGYNLAESFYMANPTMSWMTVIVGDPKSSIITSLPPRPSPVIAPPPTTCAGNPLRLEADNVSPGNMRWFSGDSATVRSLGPPYDHRHPRYLASGRSCTATMAEAGEAVFSFFNENFVGGSWSERRVQILAPFTVQLQASADTVYLDEGGMVRVSAVAEGAATFTWDMGDGRGGFGASLQHIYFSPGVFLARCTADNGACSTTAEIRITVLLKRPAVRPSQNILPFGDVKVDSTVTRTLTLSNGLNYPVTVEGIDVVGEFAQEFIPRSVQRPIPLDPEGSTRIDIDFTPKDLGMRSATIVCTLSHGLPPISVLLRGTGKPSTTSIVPLALPTIPMLHSIYPNPGRDVLVVRYALPEPGELRLTLVDEAGGGVHSLLDTHAAYGEGSATVDVRGVPAGSYWLVLESRQRHDWRRLLIMR
ncbi:MAG TPA: TIGR03790 family protein [Bacteroidota bacterium]|nr:TIGR03790 family protein [Bacteroidota bacterium]